MARYFTGASPMARSCRTCGASNPAAQSRRQGEGQALRREARCGGSPIQSCRALNKNRIRGVMHPGIDGMTVDARPEYLRHHWPEIREQLERGCYSPQPVKRVAIEKADGKKRPLGIPTVSDRLIQQAIAQVVRRRWGSLARVVDRIGTNSAGIPPNAAPTTVSALSTIGFPAASSTTASGSVTGKHLRLAVAADQQHIVRFLPRALHAG